MTFDNMNLLTERKSGMQKYLTLGLVFNHGPDAVSSMYHDWEPWVFSCLPQPNSVNNCFITWPSFFLFLPFPFWLIAFWAVQLFPALLSASHREFSKNARKYMSHMISSIQKCYRKLQKIIKCVITCLLPGNKYNQWCLGKPDQKQSLYWTGSYLFTWNCN